MPKIQPLVQRVQSPGPVDVPRANPDTMGAGFGRGLEKLGGAVSGIGELMQKAKEQEEATELSKRFSEAHAELTQELSTRVQKGQLGEKNESGEYTFTDDFKDLVSKKLEGIKQGITTRRGQLHFEQESSTTLSQMTVSAMRAQSTLVGIKAAQNMKDALAADSVSVFNSPVDYDIVKERSFRNIDNMVATNGLPFDKAEEMKAEHKVRLARAYIEGKAKFDIEGAKTDLESGKFDDAFNSDQKDQLFAKIKSEERAARTEENLIKQQEREAKKERGEEQMNQLFVDLETGKTKGFRRRVLDNPDLEQRQKEHMLKLAEAKASKQLKHDPAVVLALFNRIHADNSDPKKITSDEDLWQFFGRGLDDKKLNFLRAEVAGYKTEAGRAEAQLKAGFLKDIQSKLIKKDAFGNADPQGQESYLNFLNQFQEAYKEGKAKGFKPNELLIPTSPNYIGNLVNPYLKSPQERMKAMVETMRPVPRGTPSPTPVPKKDGESATDYLKRLGK